MVQNACSEPIAAKKFQAFRKRPLTHWTSIKTYRWIKNCMKRGRKLFYSSTDRSLNCCLPALLLVGCLRLALLLAYYVRESVAYLATQLNWMCRKKVENSESLIVVYLALFLKKEFIHIRQKNKQKKNSEDIFKNLKKKILNGHIFLIIYFK